MKAKVTWVLIADGAHARVLDYMGPGIALAPVDGLSFDDAQLMAHEIMSDRPGRSFASAGTARSAMEPRTDPVDHREAEFVRHVAEMLNQKALANEYDRLVIAAAPQALGDIRQYLHSVTKSKVLAEIPKNLINVPILNLHKHFEGVLAD